MKIFNPKNRMNVQNVISKSKQSKTFRFSFIAIIVFIVWLIGKFFELVFFVAYWILSNLLELLF